MPVDHSLSYVPQTTSMSCWAASTAMILSRSNDMEIVQEMQQQYPDSVWDDGATQLELGQVASNYGLTQIYPVCQDANGWEQWLNDNGPLMILVPGGDYHVIVVTGIRGGDQEDRSEPSEVHVLDPWYGDQWIAFDQFNTNYEIAGGGWENNVYRR